MYTRKRAAMTATLAAALAATLVVSLVAVPSGGAAAGGDPPSENRVSVPATGLTAEQWKRQEVLEAQALKIRAEGEREPTFTDVEVDVVTDTITVYATKEPAATVWDRYRSLTTAATLRYAPARLSRGQVAQMDAQVSGQRTALAAQGLDVVMWGLADGLSGPYVVTYDSGTPTVAMTSRLNLFGAGTVVLRRGEARPTGRYNDSSPFYGGANITAANVSPRYPCTSGFAARSGNTRFLTMAWHCVKLSDRRAWAANGTGVGQYIGPITHLSPLGMDAALINASSGGTNTTAKIYDGPVGYDGQNKPVVGMAGYMSGLYVCVSGSYVRVVCNARMASQMHYIATNLYDTRQETHVNGYFVRRDTAEPIIATGDSGGPVFTNTNNNTQAIARAMISGGTDKLGCPPRLSDRVSCWRTAFVVDAPIVASQFGITFTGF
ncbi:MAG TPA: hypothetical protein VFT95_03690 [Micromonosporaceae bacterium]|nr:hypothetical protein [Micromonosporaceae bacterium]